MPLQLDPIQILAPTAQTAETLQQSQVRGLQAQEAQLQLQQQQEAERRKQAFRGELASVATRPSSEGYTRLMNLYPEFASTIKPGIEQLNAQEKTQMQAQMIPAHSAFVNKRPDLAFEHLEKLAQGYDNSQRPDKAVGVRKIIEMGKQDPNVAASILGGYLSESMGKDGFDGYLRNFGLSTDLRKKEADATSAEAKAEADKAYLADTMKQELALKKAQTGLTGVQGEQGQFNLKMDKEFMPAERAVKRDIEAQNLAKLARDNRIGDEFDRPDREDRQAQAAATLDQTLETTANIGADNAREDKKFTQHMNEVAKRNKSLPVPVQERIVGLMKDTNAARNTVKTVDDLLVRLRRDVGTQGVIGRGKEWFLKQVGMSGAERKWHVDFSNLLMKEVLKNVPSGPLTEKEQAIIREGFPETFDSKEVLEQYLRAARSLAEKSAAENAIKVDFQSLNQGNPSRAIASFQIKDPAGSIQVNEGDTYDEVLQDILLLREAEKERRKK